MKTKIILYGSLTGNTQMTAMTLAGMVGCESLSFDEVDQKVVVGHDLLVVGISTWGEGDYNPATEDFVARLGKDLDFSDKKIALFGLGDSTYQIFCGAVDKLKIELEKNVAQIIGQIHKIDGWLDEEKEKDLLAWVSSLGK